LVIFGWITCAACRIYRADKTVGVCINLTVSCAHWREWDVVELMAKEEDEDCIVDREVG
jgi:hypothetical protein